MLDCLCRTPRFTRGGELSDNQISFSTSTVNGWQGINNGSRAAVTAGESEPLKMESSLGHPLYLHPIEQAGIYVYNAKDELITRSGAPLPSDGNLLHADNANAKTRGAKFTDASLTNAFGVSAIFTNNNITSSYFQNLKATPNNGSWVTSEAKYWPTDGSLSFYAYYPYSTDSHNMLSEDATVDVSKARIVHYVASATDIVNQPDLIVANHPNVTHGSTDAPNSVDLNFSHVLTAITFAVGSDMVPGTVKSIAIKGVKNTGDYDLSIRQWTTSGNDADFTISLGNGQGKVVTGKQDEALTTGAQTLMMIPQTFDANSNAKVEIVFTKTGGQEQTLSASLANTSWAEGSTIIYKVSTSSLLPTLTLNNVTFPTDWSSRAEYTGKLKSTWQDNDQLGLYVVAPDGKVKAANVQVTCKGGKWSFPAATQPHINVGDKVFAYYPYQKSPQDGLPSNGQTVDVTTLTSANAFFKKLEDAWTPNADQSTMDKMNGNDLQVANAILNSTGSGIDLAMTHAMGLADITIGTSQVHFKLSNDASYTWDNYHLASEQFADKKPCKVADAHYVAVVKPNVATKFNSATGVDYAWKNELSFSPAANQITRGTAVPEDNKINPFTLELGDIYYSDGALTHQADNLARNKAPIGIVVYIASGKGDDNYWVEKNTKRQGIGGHALVICPKEIGSTGISVHTQYVFGPLVDYGREKMTTAKKIKESGNQPYGSGYKETKAYVDMGQQMIAANIVSNYQVYSAPSDKSTGWFLPSIGQLYAICSQLYPGFDKIQWALNNVGVINEPSIAITKKIDGFFKSKFNADYTEFIYPGDGYYVVSSSEYSSSLLIALDPAANNGGGSYSFQFYAASYSPKNAQYYNIRPFLAF